MPGESARQSAPLPHAPPGLRPPVVDHVDRARLLSIGDVVIRLETLRALNAEVETAGVVAVGDAVILGD